MGNAQDIYSCYGFEIDYYNITNALTTITLQMHLPYQYQPILLTMNRHMARPLFYIVGFCFF